MSVTTSPAPRHADDFYIEPEWCVHALLDAERFDGLTLDPACGSGTIPRVLRSRGLPCASSDIVARGQRSEPRDFLTDPPKPLLPINIICNPPYRLAVAFIEQALRVAERKVAMIVQQQFPYSQGRHRLFTTTPLARVYFLSDRPSMPPGDKFLAGECEAKGGSVDYLWMVWEHGHVGPPTAHWLRRSPTP